MRAGLTVESPEEEPIERQDRGRKVRVRLVCTEARPQDERRPPDADAREAHARRRETGDRCERHAELDDVLAMMGRELEAQAMKELGLDRDEHGEPDRHEKTCARDERPKRASP